MATIQERKGKNGSTFRVLIRIKGFPEQVKSFKRRTDAKLWAQQTESAIRKGEFKSVTTEARRHTLKVVIHAYREEVMPHKAPSTQRSEKTFLNFWENELGDYALSFLDADTISKKITALTNAGDTRQKLVKDAKPNKPKSKKTIKHYRDTLERLLNFAKQKGWMGQNPMDGVPRVTKINNARTRYLDDDERKALLKSCKESPNELLYPIVIFALSTGARLGEITGLTLSDINLAFKKAILRDTKNGETRSVPIMGHLNAVLKAHISSLDKFYEDKEVETKWLFPRKDSLKPIDIRKAWVNAREEAKIDDFRFHDLRHSAASYLAMNGASLLEIAAVLGHKTLQMVKRYSHLSEDHTQSVVEKMNEKIF